MPGSGLGSYYLGAMKMPMVSKFIGSGMATNKIAIRINEWQFDTDTRAPLRSDKDWFFIGGMHEYEPSVWTQELTPGYYFDSLEHALEIIKSNECVLDFETTWIGSKTIVSLTYTNPKKSCVWEISEYPQKRLDK